MPQTYFTADWHFSHPNIARYCPQFRLQSDEGKSTLVTQLFTLYCIVTAQKHYCVIVMDSAETANPTQKGTYVPQSTPAVHRPKT